MGFIKRRDPNKHPGFLTTSVARYSAMYPVNESPEHAVGRCLDFWNRFGARGETPGYREELALHGWTGTEIVIGSDFKEWLWSGVTDDWVNFAPRLFDAGDEPIGDCGPPHIRGGRVLYRALLHPKRHHFAE